METRRSIPSLAEPLSDGIVTLRFGEERDIPEVLVAHDDDSTLPRALGLLRAPSGAELGRAIEEAPARRAAGLGENLTVLAPRADRRGRPASDAGGGVGAGRVFAGQLTVHSLDWYDMRAELGIWLRRPVRGRGFGRRALVLVSRWLIEDGGLTRVALSTSPENAAMIACAQAAGFRQEGILRGHRRIGDRREDELVLSLLPEDLPDLDPEPDRDRRVEPGRSRRAEPDRDPRAEPDQNADRA